MPSQQKIDQVGTLAGKLKGSTSVIVADYRGLTVGEANELRGKMRAVSAEYKVAKNRLIKRALADCGLPTLDDILIGPTAIGIGDKDPVAPAKALWEFAKKSDKVKIKGGLLGSRILDIQGVESLATLPSREVLLGRLLGSMMAPPTKLAVGLRQTVAKVAYALQAVADSKAA